MKTLTTLFAAAAIMASVSAPTFAQVSVDGAVDAAGSVAVGSGEGNTSTGANATVGANATAQADINYGSIISELRTSSATAADIQALGSDVQITVVTLSELRGNAGENANALEKAVSAQGTAMADLKAAIEGNDELRADVEAALSAKGDFTLDDVVSISASADGQLTLVIDDVE